MRIELACVLLLGGAARGQLVAADPMLMVDAGGHNSTVRALQFSRDGRWLISAGDDKVVRVWDTLTGRTARTLRGEIAPGIAGSIYAMALSPDDRYLAVAGNLAGDVTQSRAVRVHDFQTGEVVRLLVGHKDVVVALAFSPDGRWMASGSGDRTVRLWEVGAWKAVHTWDRFDGRVYTLAWASNSRLAAGSLDRKIRLLDTGRGTPVQTLTGHRSAVGLVVYSPGSRYLVSSGEDAGALIWDLADPGRSTPPQPIDTGDQRSAALAFSPSGRELIVSGSSEQKRFWCDVLEFPGGRRTLRFDGHEGFVFAIAVAPDGETVASADIRQNEILLWSLRTGRLLRRLGGQGRPVTAIALRRDGKAIAFGSRLFDPPQVNAYGPVDRTLMLEEDGETTVALGHAPGVRDFIGPNTTFGDFTLQVGDAKSGEFRQYAVLKVLKNGREHREFPARNATSGFRHNCFTFLPDGSGVISGGMGGVLALYSLADPQAAPQQFVGHSGEVLSVAVHGDTLVSGSGDQTIRLWDIRTRVNFLTIFVAADSEWVAFTSEGYYTSSVRGDTYMGWQLNRGPAAAARYYSASQFQKDFYRPEIVSQRIRARSAQPFAVDLAAMEPPEIRITDSASGDRVQVRIEVSSPSLPITNVRVFWNGDCLPAGSLSPSQPATPNRQTFELLLPLRQGANSLYVTASHAKATARGEDSVQGNSQALASMTPRELRVSVIGINAYRNPKIRLDYPEEDAAAVLEALGRQAGRYSKVDAHLLRSAEADRARILAEAKWLNKSLNEGADGVFFMAGHAGISGDFYYLYSNQHQNDLDEADSTTDVGWAELLNELTKGDGSRNRGKLTVLLDACYAGRAGTDVRFIRTLKESAEAANGTVYAYTAAAPQEQAREIADLKHGFFTAALLEALRKGSPGDPLYSDELAVRIRQVVERYNKKYDRVQRPAHFTLPIGMPAEVLFSVVRP